MRYLRETSDLRDAEKGEKRVAVKYAFEENNTGSDGGMLRSSNGKIRKIKLNQILCRLRSRIKVRELVP
jgi:hypothetical protein